MAGETSVVEEQLELDKAVKSINSYLDKQEQVIMLRGRKEDEMRGDYQNLLTYHQQILKNVFLTDPCEQKAHVNYLISFRGQEPREYFKAVAAGALGLNELIDSLPKASYQEVITSVRKTISSRINYFDALLKALPIGRYSYPVDVAWFHRNNEALAKHYLAEHDNDILSLPEDVAVKEACDFKVRKLAVVSGLIALTPLSSSNKFFTPGDDVKCEVANYLRHYLQEPVRALAENDRLLDPGKYIEELIIISEQFQKRLSTLKANNKEDSIALSEAAVKLVQALTEDRIMPFFKAVSEEFKPEPSLSQYLTGLHL